MTQYYVDVQARFSFAVESLIALKHVYWISMPRTKGTEGVKWRFTGMRNADMQQFDIARVLNLSQSVAGRLLKKRRETDSFKEQKQSR